MFEENLNSSPELSHPRTWASNLVQNTQKSKPYKKNLILYDIVPMAHHKKPILLEK
jgi:hypothetical protein